MILAQKYDDFGIFGPSFDVDIDDIASIRDLGMWHLQRRINSPCVASPFSGKILLVPHKCHLKETLRFFLTKTQPLQVFSGSNSSHLAYTFSP